MYFGISSNASLPKNISSPILKVGIPKTPKSTDFVVLSSNLFLEDGSSLTFINASASSPSESR